MNRQLIILILFLIINHIHAQVQKPEYKADLFTGIGLDPEIAYREDFTRGSITITTTPRVCYFAGNRLALCYGLSIVSGKEWYPGNLQQYSSLVSSPAIRYYMLKNNILFVETGIQSGIFNNHGDKYNQKGYFNQAGIGLGINLLSAYHEGLGRFAFEFLVRDNFPFKSFDEKNNFIPFNLLGSGIGIYYIIEPARNKNAYSGMPVQEALQTDRDSIASIGHYIKNGIKSIQTIYASSPMAISYGYEKTLTERMAVNMEVSIKRLNGLLYDTAFIRPALKIEPRYYYGFFKRTSRGQNIRNNSSDFLSLEAGYITVLAAKPVNSGHELHLIPKWGLRRALGTHFIIDFAIGYGIYGEIYKQKLRVGHTPGFELRLGYCFNIVS